MISSMTGFGTAEGPVGPHRVTIEVRSVNHRFFNPTLKLPGRYARWEGEVREALRKRLGRGHVTVYARVEDAATDAPVAIDEARFAAYVAQLRMLQAKHGLSAAVDVGAILRLPDVIAAPRDEEGGTAEELLAIVALAADDLVAMRRAEGARLATYLEERLAEIDAALARIAARAPARVTEQRDRLRANVQELLDGRAMDEARLAQEIALLADRLDVAEEMSRFAAHVAAFRESLHAPGTEGVGKRLGFLVQEMLREANTTGSKANDAAITRDVLLVKEELERIREQVENLE